MLQNTNDQWCHHSWYCFFLEDLVFFISSDVLVFFLWLSSVFFMSELNVVNTTILCDSDCN